MSERLIDSVCPHCGRLGTTVRVVKHEDGFTKLSRTCTSCGGEWIHTFDADWLAVANRRRLEAEVERLRRAHQAACEGGDLLREEIERLTRERDEARAEVERLRDALVLGSEVLASHQGSPGREWHSGGAWLYPGDRINVMRAPLPEIEVEP